ncbi:hypothetical protein [Microbacterium sp. CJ88]|uniref:hypothetical protein n=1 Tax=Microbacterium sp. CJ88 TaxID=3445672 RepID=UPI003F6565EC
MTAREQERSAEAATEVAPARKPALIRLRDGAVRVLEAMPVTNVRTAPIAAGTIGRVLVLWGAARAINLMIMWSWYQISKAYGWGFGPNREHVTTFLNFLSDWDGARYGRIAQVGYPTWLPMDPSGVVQPSDWAFMPIYPALERGLSEVLGIPWQAAGVAISILASAGATVMLYLLLRKVTSARASWWGTVMFSIGPLSFVFVLAYAESLVLFLTFACLYLAVVRKYWWIAPIGVVASFVRPGLLAVALGLGILFLVRWVRREQDPFSIRERWGIIVSGATIGIAGLAWSQIATMVTGTKDAYVRTETAWWIPFIGEGHFVPLTPWFRLAGTWLGIGGIILVLTIAGFFIAWMRSKQIRALGIEVWAYTASYLLYLFAVFLPQQSTFRLLLPVAPLLADDRLSSTPRRQRWVVVVCLVLQVVAVLLLWTIGWP